MHLEEALSSKMDIKAFIFDMDGLLFDSERIVQRSWEMAGDELEIPHMGGPADTAKSPKGTPIGFLSP